MSRRPLPQTIARPWRRQLRRSSSAVPPAPPCAGIAPLGSRRVLRLCGPDAAKYLQSAVTANLLAATASVRTDSFYAAFLTAQGRIRHDVFVHPGLDGPSFFVDVDAEHAAGLAGLINRYKLRARFAVSLLDERVASVWQAWDDGCGADHSALLRLAHERSSRDTMVAVDSRAPDLGFRILHLSSSLSSSYNDSFRLSLEPATETAFCIRRMLRGVPEGQRELAPEASLPLEANMDLMGAIDFHKGCYVGQELTIRTKHRGVVRKRVLPCMLYEEDKDKQTDRDASPPPTELAYDAARAGAVAAHRIPAGAEIGRVGKKSTRTAAGRWLGGVGNVGLALCRLDVMTDLAPLPGEASVYDAQQEFEMGASIRVKAFVPGWIRRELEPRGGDCT